MADVDSGSGEEDELAHLRAENARLQAIVAGLGGSGGWQAGDSGGSPLWSRALALSEAREPTAGSPQALSHAIGTGADLRIITHFRHNEHIAPSSSNAEMVLEPSQFPITLALYDAADDELPSWVAGVMMGRLGCNPADSTGTGGFNGDASSTSSLSLFMYNQDGQQARASVSLSASAITTASQAPPGSSSTPGDFPKSILGGMMEIQSENDAGTASASINFVYRFQSYEFFVSTRWKLALHNSASGEVLGGSFEALADASASGSRIKVGVRNLAADLLPPGGDGDPHHHDIYVECGWCFYYPESRKFSAATQPLVRVCPSRPPLLYQSKRWDLGSLFIESTGAASYRRLDPYTLQWADVKGDYECRWFVQQ